MKKFILLALFLIFLYGCSSPIVPAEENTTNTDNPVQTNYSPSVYNDPLLIPAPGNDKGNIRPAIEPSLLGTNENMNIKLEIMDNLPKSLVIQNDGKVIFTEGDTTN